MPSEAMSLELIRAALWVFLFGIFFASLYLKIWLAIAIAGVKVLVSVVYFWSNPDGIWQLLDDQTYFFIASVLETAGYSPLWILRDPQGFLFMKSLAGSESIAYYWWNFLVMHILGFEYHSTVLVNVGSTFVSGYFFYRILAYSDFSRRYAAIGGGFFLLHWDIVAWSSFLNIKDNLVLMLTLICWDCVLRLFDRLRVTSLALLILCLFLLSFFRFYLPALIIGMILIGVVIRTRGWKRYLFGAVAVGALVILVGSMSQNITPYLHLAGVPMGFIRFWMTPQPWSVDASNSFLEIPSFFHWLLLLPSFVAARALWKESPNARTILMYGFLLTAFYAAIPEVQGPRHRYQISFVVIWMQFHFLVMMYRVWQKRHSTLRPSTLPTPSEGSRLS